MEIKIGNKNYELKTNLFVVKKMQGTFKKPFTKIIENLGNMELEEQIKLLLCGSKEDDRAEIETAIYENLGFNDLLEKLQDFIMQIQYHGLSKEEIEEKNAKSLENYERMKKIGLIK